MKKGLLAAQDSRVRRPGAETQLRTSGENLHLSRLHLPQEGPTTGSWGIKAGKGHVHTWPKSTRGPELALLHEWAVNPLS